MSYSVTAGRLPVMLRQVPAPGGAQQGKVGDIHRFWEQTGNFYLTGKGNDNLVDPFIGASLVSLTVGLIFANLLQPGHALNNELLRAVFADAAAFAWK